MGQTFEEVKEIVIGHVEGFMPIQIPVTLTKFPFAFQIDDA